jgi:hypothetical protein
VTQDNTLARSLHDLGLATWFGGSLMGAVGLNGAAAVVDQPAQRLRVANAGWARWTPVNLAGIAAHLADGAVLLTGNKGRLATQRGVASATVAKATVTGLALAATAYARALGERLMQAGDAPVEGRHHPSRRHAAGSGRGAAAADRAAMGDPWADRGGAGAERAHGRTAASPAGEKRAGGGAAQPPASAGPSRYGPAGQCPQPAQDHHRLRRITTQAADPEPATLPDRRWLRLPSAG